MLEGLDKINWSQLHHAYDEASDVPVLIHQLLSEEDDIVDEAIYELFGNIYHQGTVYQASAYAVPFLQELLNSSEITEKIKTSIACLLASMADSYEIEDGSYAEAAQIAVEKELRSLFPYLSCEVPIVRESVAGALAHYPQYSGETLPMLEKALALESDEEAKEKIAEAVEILRSEQANL
jgi:hypothetical protein